MRFRATRQRAEQGRQGSGAPLHALVLAPPAARSRAEPRAPPPSLPLPQARAKLDKYEEMDPSFSDSREAKLVKDLLVHCQAFDTEQFTQTVFEYDSVSKLDAWKTGMLLKVKVALKEGGDSLT